MSSMKERVNGKLFWRSLDDLADTPEFRAFVQREFPAHAEEMLEPSRRNFLKLMGASVALAGMTACRRWPSEQIVPFAHRPEGYTPGVPQRFATAMDLNGAATGLLVTSYDGRPIKVEGNPAHPDSLGATGVLPQAAVLDIYDPDRSTRIVEIDRGQARPREWDEFAAALAPVLSSHRGNGGAGLRVLSETSSSPTLQDMKARFLAAFPRARWHEYEPLTRDNERDGVKLAFGRPLRAQYALDKADVVVALDADLLANHPAALRHSREFARWRRVKDRRMNRLWVVETSYSVTGGSADHRMPVPSRKVAVVAGHLAAHLTGQGLQLPAGTEPLRSAVEALAAEPLAPEERKFVAAMAKDLLDRRGAALIAVGPKQPPAVHALAHVLNEALGNAGGPVTYTADPEGERPSHAVSIRALAKDMASGSVDTLLILGGNPVFDAPADVSFAAALEKVKTPVRLGLHLDETSLASRWHVPKAHFLEAWSDARGWDGTLSVVQPLIEPLYGGKTPAEMVAFASGDPATKSYDIVRRTWVGILGEADFERRWRRALHDGVLEASAFTAEPATPVAASWAGDLAALVSAGEGDGLEVVFERDYKIHDGRFANNGWLQELPDPIARMTWDNPAWISPATAAQLGLASGDVVRVRCGGRSADVPVFLIPGQAPGTITVFPGSGRRQAGSVGDGVGFDVYPLRATDALFAATATVEKTGRTHPLATTQDHHIVDSLGRMEREIRSETLIREAELATYLEEPDFAKHVVHLPEDVHLWDPHKYDGYKWGMSIDLTACIGCAACTIACQAENNIPVVGKSEVLRGREMHWIRVDRYFQGDASSPAMAFQPLTCHHCENAPCESVCPVAATVHDHEGLNVMVYNRCIGTRYCSNNCPYKVRRFNWFNNHKNPSAVEMMVYNPEVSLRSRGVMEKCTFCVQRIEGAKIRAKNEGRRVQDGEIVPACAQACPTEAIVFGDLNDPDSRVRRLHQDDRTYGVLDEINTKPRLRYMARLRNRSLAAGPAAERKA